jgi:hypothetical protein
MAAARTLPHDRPFQAILDGGEHGVMLVVGRDAPRDLMVATAWTAGAVYQASGVIPANTFAIAGVSTFCPVTTSPTRRLFMCSRSLINAASGAAAAPSVRVWVALK